MNMTADVRGTRTVSRGDTRPVYVLSRSWRLPRAVKANVFQGENKERSSRATSLPLRQSPRAFCVCTGFPPSPVLARSTHEGSAGRSLSLI